jgi:hypothetical protein
MEQYKEIVEHRLREKQFQIESQEEKIHKLTQLIVVSSRIAAKQSNGPDRKKAKSRRETWCPGKLKSIITAADASPLRAPHPDTPSTEHTDNSCYSPSVQSTPSSSSSSSAVVSKSEEIKKWKEDSLAISSKLSLTAFNSPHAPQRSTEEVEKLTEELNAVKAENQQLRLDLNDALAKIEEHPNELYELTVNIQRVNSYYYLEYC